MPSDPSTPDRAPRRVVLLGGSSAFTPRLAVALADRSGHLPPLDVALVGRRAAATEATARFCGLVADAAGADQRYSASTDADAALVGADVVLLGVRVGGFAGRERDERIALDRGWPGDETIGPGGLAAAVRSLPVLTDLARRAARLAPGAPLVCLSNPLGLLVAALAREPGVRAFGLCELPEATLRSACAAAGLDAATIDADYVGLNHQGAFTALRDARGVCRLDEVLGALASLDDAASFGVEPATMARRGDLPVSYLRLYEHTARERDRQRARRTSRGAELGALADQLHAHYARTDDPRLPAPLLQRAMPWNELAIVPALEALFDGRPRRLALTVPNDGYLPGLPDDAPIERFGVQVPLGAAPPRPRFDVPAAHAGLAFAARIAAFEARALAAAGDPTPAKLEAALAAHPWALSPEDRRVVAGRIAAEVAAPALALDGGGAA